MTTNNKEDKKIKVAITHGDINGVGYEVILKTFGDSRMYDICTPVLYGSTKVASYHKKLLTSMPQEMQFNGIREAREAAAGKFNVLNLVPDEVKISTVPATTLRPARSMCSSPPQSTNATYRPPTSISRATPNISRISSVPPRLCSWSVTVSASASSPTTLPSRTSPQRLHTTCFLIN